MQKDLNENLLLLGGTQGLDLFKFHIRALGTTPHRYNFQNSLRTLSFSSSAPFCRKIVRPWAGSKNTSETKIIIRRLKLLDLSREKKVAGKDEWENKIVGVVNPMEKHQGTIKSAEFIPGETGIFFSMDLRLVSF